MSHVRHLAPLAALLALTLPVDTALALATPKPASQDNRVRFISYEPYNVTRIVGSLRSSVQVEFAQDEEIVHVAAGNNIAWEVAPAGSILFLKPREHQPITNLQVVTARRDGSKRSYQFELTVRDGALGAGNDTYFYVRFRYPGDEAEAARREAAAKAAASEARHADEVLDFHNQYGPRNWRYTAQGAASIEPVSVYDNGKVTTFTFPGNQEVPAIYLVNTDGSESLVPKSVEGKLVTVHAIGAKFVLRRGKDVTCIFNEAYVPAGVDPGTNTTSPSVERVVKATPDTNR